jgi:hypothetical protein
MGRIESFYAPLKRPRIRRQILDMNSSEPIRRARSTTSRCRPVGIRARRDLLRHDHPDRPRQRNSYDRRFGLAARFAGARSWRENGLSHHRPAREHPGGGPRRISPLRDANDPSGAHRQDTTGRVSGAGRRPAMFQPKPRDRSLWSRLSRASGGAGLNRKRLHQSSYGRSQTCHFRTFTNRAATKGSGLTRRIRDRLSSP